MQIYQPSVAESISTIERSLPVETIGAWEWCELDSGGLLLLEGESFGKVGGSSDGNGSSGGGGNHESHGSKGNNWKSQGLSVAGLFYVGHTKPGVVMKLWGEPRLSDAGTMFRIGRWGMRWIFYMVFRAPLLWIRAGCGSELVRVREVRRGTANLHGKALEVRDEGSKSRNIGNIGNNSKKSFINFLKMIKTTISHIVSRSLIIFALLVELWNGGGKRGILAPRTVLWHVPSFDEWLLLEVCIEKSKPNVLILIGERGHECLHIL